MADLLTKGARPARPDQHRQLADRRRSPSPCCTPSPPSAAQALGIPAGTPFYEESTFWNPSWTIAHGAVQTTNIYDMDATAAAIGSGKLLSPRVLPELMTRPTCAERPHAQPGCPTCCEQTDGYTYGLGIVISGDWLLQNPMFAGHAAVEAYLPSQKIAIAVAVTYPPEAFDDAGRLPQRGRGAVPQIGAELAPDDAPPDATGRSNGRPWHPRFCSSATNTSRPRRCSARRSPTPVSTSRRSRSSRAERADTRRSTSRFPDPHDYDVIVPLGSTLAGVRRGAAKHLGRRGDAADARRRRGGHRDCWACASAGSCWRRPSAARSPRSTAPRSAGTTWRPIEPDMVPAGPWFQWHFDRWTLPPGATEIARNRQRVAGLRARPALALQFHPELDADLLETVAGR